MGLGITMLLMWMNQLQFRSTKRIHIINIDSVNSYNAWRIPSFSAWLAAVIHSNSCHCSSFACSIPFFSSFFAFLQWNITYWLWQSGLCQDAQAKDDFDYVYPCALWQKTPSCKGWMMWEWWECPVQVSWAQDMQHLYSVWPTVKKYYYYIIPKSREWEGVNLLENWKKCCNCWS